MAVQDFPFKVPPDRGLSWRPSGECRGSSGRCCSISRRTSDSNRGDNSNMYTRICICSCLGSTTDFRCIPQVGVSAEPDEQPWGSTFAIPEGYAAAAVTAPAASASTAAILPQAAPLAQRRSSTLNSSRTCETGGSCGSSCSSASAVWAAASAAAAPTVAEPARVKITAAVEGAAVRTSREGVAAAGAATYVRLKSGQLVRRLHCCIHHGRSHSQCSNNLIKCNNGGSTNSYSGDGCGCTRNGSNCASASTCLTSNSRSSSAVVLRLPVSRSQYAACSSSSVVATASREQQLALHGLKRHSEAGEQQLLQHQQFQLGEDEDPKMLQIMRTHAFLHLTSGAVAGAVSRTATAPLDRVKVMLQLQPSSVPLRQAARVIMQQELSGKAAAAAVSSTGAPPSIAPSNKSNASSSSNSSSTARRSPQPSSSDGKAPSQQAHQRQGVRTAVPLAIPGSSSSCCSNSSSSMRSGGRLLLGGWRGFFRGNLTNCLKVVPETAVKFYSYDICKHALAHRKQQQQQQQPQQQQSAEPAQPHLQLLDRFLCGATAGLCAQLLIYPMELVKTRLAAYGPGCMYTGVLQCFKAIYREGGFRRLYRGVGPSLLGIIPYAGIDLAVFETLKEAYVKRVIIPKQQQQVEQQQLLHGTCSNCNPKTSPTKMASIAIPPNAAAPAGAASSTAGLARGRCCCDESSSSSGLPPASPPAAVLLLMGGCSSLIGQVLAYPTALVRTRMQVDGSGGQPLLYRNSAAAAAAAVRQGGLRGLYRGLQANCCKALPAVSLSWIVYEKMKYAISNFERDWTQKVEQQRLAARNRP